MKTKRKLLSAVVGLWASGMLIGGNIGNYVPFEPGWPSWLLIVIGGLVGIGSLLSMLNIEKTQFRHVG